MSRTLTLELPDEVFAALETEARAIGRPITELALARLTSNPAGRTKTDLRSDEEKEAARRAFRDVIGIINMPEAVGLDNEQIDAELAREYADTHEEA